MIRCKEAEPLAMLSPYTDWNNTPMQNPLSLENITPNCEYTANKNQIKKKPLFRRSASQFIAAIFGAFLGILALNIPAFADNDLTPRKVTSSQNTGRNLSTVNRGAETQPIGQVDEYVQTDSAIPDQSKLCYYLDRENISRRVPTFYRTDAEWLNFLATHPKNGNGTAAHPDGIKAARKCCAQASIPFTGSLVCTYGDSPRTQATETMTIDRGVVETTGRAAHTFSCQKTLCSNPSNPSTCGVIAWTEEQDRAIKCIDPQPSAWNVAASWGWQEETTHATSNVPSNCPPQAHGAIFNVLDYTSSSPVPAGECPWGNGTREYRIDHYKTYQCLNGTNYNTGATTASGAYGVGECAPEPIAPLTGTVVNALNVAGVAGALISLRESETGPIVYQMTTNGSGGFSQTIHRGTYYAEISATGYITAHEWFSVTSSSSNTKQFVLSPVLEGKVARIVLQWGANPSDLDSHLTGPGFHISYLNKVSGGNADLDVDDTSSYGPETVTLASLKPGTYRYSIHDYTNRESGYSYDLAASGATVKIFRDDGTQQTFTVPNAAGTLWAVFQIDGLTRTVTPLNQMSYESEPAAVP